MGFFRSEHTDQHMLLQDLVPYAVHQMEEPFFRKITILSTFVLFSNAIATVIYCIINWDLELAVKIGHVQILCCYIMCMAVVGMSVISNIKKQKFDEMRNELWSIDELGPEIAERINKSRKFLQNSRVIISITTSVIFLFCMPISGDYREFSILTFSIEDKVNKTIFRIILHLTSIFYILYYNLMNVNITFMAVATTLEVINNILMVREKLMLIEKVYGKREMLFYDKRYQEFVGNSLRKCIIQHLNILRYASIVKREVEKGMLIGAMVGTASLAFLYYTTKMNMEIKVALKSVFLQGVSFLYLGLYAVSGQLLLDECERFYRDLCECPWILWNKSNKATYLIMLTRIRVPLVFNKLDYNLNLNILVVIVRKTLSAFTAMQRIASLN